MAFFLRPGLLKAGTGELCMYSSKQHKISKRQLKGFSMKKKQVKKKSKAFQAACFCCGAAMHTACLGVDCFETPSYGLVFDGGSSFGSQLYDSLIDGISVRIIICDKCLHMNKHRLKEVQN